MQVLWDLLGVSAAEPPSGGFSKGGAAASPAASTASISTAASSNAFSLRSPSAATDASGDTEHAASGDETPPGCEGDARQEPQEDEPESHEKPAMQDAEAPALPIEEDAEALAPPPAPDEPAAADSPEEPASPSRRRGLRKSRSPRRLAEDAERPLAIPDFVSAPHRRSLRKSRSARHLEEALEEEAGAAVLRHALSTADEHRCGSGLLARAADRLVLVEGLEAAEVEASRRGALERAEQEALDTARWVAQQQLEEQLEQQRRAKAARTAAVRDMEAAHDFEDLKRAIQAARALEVSAKALRPSLERLQAMAVRGMEVADTLDALARAIEEARGAEVGPAAIRQFQDELDGLAVDSIETAAGFDAFMAAVHTAQRVAASAAVLQPFQERLAAAVTVQETLVWALQTQNADGIREAIEKAEVGMLNAVQLDHAKAMLAVEEAKENERRAQARHRLWTVAMEAYKLDLKVAEFEVLVGAKEELQDALLQASDAGLPEIEVFTIDKYRRRIHNAIEDRRGAVRVYCRVRPPQTHELAAGEQVVTTCCDGFNIQVAPAQGRHESDAPWRQVPSVFDFDACWGAGTQQEIFEDVKDLVQSAVDGYNVTVFAYGQTGAGKTHTMYGPKEAVQRSSSRKSLAAGDAGGAVAPASFSKPDEARGICPRTTEEVFRIVSRDSNRFDFTVSFSMVELYCQRFIDLLNLSSNRPLRIRTLPSGEVYLENQEEVVVHNVRDVERLMRMGLAERKVRSTALNSQSSRSHVIFVLKINSVNRKTQAATSGKISLADLAGSERVKKSEVSGEGLREAIEVNRSLSALADVVAAIARGEKHVPYRNHELTQSLQDALGGNSKTLMLVNLSPLGCHTEETMNAIKFAQRVKGAIFSPVQRLRSKDQVREKDHSPVQRLLSRDRSPQDSPASPEPRARPATELCTFIASAFEPVPPVA